MSYWDQFDPEDGDHDLWIFAARLVLSLLKITAAVLMVGIAILVYVQLR
jgi:hypothetical protein